MAYPIGCGQEYPNDVNKSFPRWPFRERVSVSCRRYCWGFIQPRPTSAAHVDLYGVSIPWAKYWPYCRRVYQSVYKLALDFLRTHHMVRCYLGHNSPPGSRNIPSSSFTKQGQETSQRDRRRPMESTNGEDKQVDSQDYCILTVAAGTIANFRANVFKSVSLLGHPSRYPLSVLRRLPSCI
jgi:hypothetical protein